LDRSITSTSHGSAAGKASRKKVIGIGPEVVKFARSDWSAVALIVWLVAVGALRPRNTGGIMVSGNWLGVQFAVQSGKHVVVADHGSRAVLNFERRHAILCS